MTIAQRRDQCAADLVGQQERCPELFDRRAGDAGRGRELKLTMNDATLSDDEADLFIRWKTVAFDVDPGSATGRVSIVIEDGVLGPRPGAQDETTLVDVQNQDDLVGNVINRSIRRDLSDGDVPRVSSTPSR